MSVVDDLKKSHDEILLAIEGLSTVELECPKTLGDWSIRDALLHIAMWEGEVLKLFAIWRSGQKVDWSYVGDMKSMLRFNDFWIGNMKYLSTKKVLKLLGQIHSAIVADVSAVVSTDPEGHKLPEWLDEIVISHNKTHIEKIREYRKSSKQ